MKWCAALILCLFPLNMLGHLLLNDKDASERLASVLLLAVGVCGLVWLWRVWG